MEAIAFSNIGEQGSDEGSGSQDDADGGGNDEENGKTEDDDDSSNDGDNNNDEDDEEDDDSKESNRLYDADFQPDDDCKYKQESQRRKQVTFDRYSEVRIQRSCVYSVAFPSGSDEDSSYKYTRLGAPKNENSATKQIHPTIFTPPRTTMRSPPSFKGLLKGNDVSNRKKEELYSVEYCATGLFLSKNGSEPNGSFVGFTDDDRMKDVLKMLWQRYIRTYFLIEFTFFCVLLLTWLIFQEVVDTDHFMIATSCGGIATTFKLILTAKKMVTTIILFRNSLEKDPLVKDINNITKDKTTGKDLFFKRCRIHFQDTLNILDMCASCFVTISFLLFKLKGDTGEGNGNSNSTLTAAIIGVCTTAVLSLQLLTYLRGFEVTEWLMFVLTQHIKEMMPICCFLGLMVVSFSFAFRRLLQVVDSDCDVNVNVEIDLETTNSTGVYTYNCDASPFQSFSQVAFGVLSMGVTNNFETDYFDDALSPITAKFLFILLIVVVPLLTLMTLVASLISSYTRLLLNAKKYKNLAKAELMVEYLALYPNMYADTHEDDDNGLKNNSIYFHFYLKEPPVLSSKAATAATAATAADDSYGSLRDFKHIVEETGTRLINAVDYKFFKLKSFTQSLEDEIVSLHEISEDIQTTGSTLKDISEKMHERIDEKLEIAGDAIGALTNRVDGFEIKIDRLEKKIDDMSKQVGKDVATMLEMLTTLQKARVSFVKRTYKEEVV